QELDEYLDEMQRRVLEQERGG
ncbi:anti-sigma factor antagonist, partial [Pantoea dispersa]